MASGLDIQDGAVRVYQAPTLKVFGNVVALTASGTGTRREAGSPGNCSQDRGRSPCRL